MLGVVQKLLPLCRDDRLALIPWKDRELDSVAALSDIARVNGVPLTTLAVAWVLANPAATDYALEPALKEKLDQLSIEYRMGDAAR